MSMQTKFDVFSFACQPARLLRGACALSFVFLLIITSPVQADGSCSGATPMDLDSSLRSHVDAGEFMVELYVPSAGILSVNAAVPSLTVTKPQLGLERRACGALRNGSEPLVLERYASHLVFAVESAGSYVFRVASMDSSQQLSELRVSTAFVAAGGYQTVPSRDGEDEEEIEIEADPLMFPGGFPTKDGEDEEEIEIEADPFTAGGDYFNKDGEDEEEIEIEADPLIHSGPAADKSLHSKLAELCRVGEVDDHGDSFTCATFLRPGQDISGVVSNDWGDDVDVFQFVLGSPRGSDLWTVAIESVSTADGMATIYDHSGQPLAETDLGGDSRIANALRPGTYFVRVEGRDRAEGNYALRVLVSPW